MSGDPLEIPLPTDTPLFTFRTTLNEVEYLFRFDWNGREGRWYFSLGDINEDWIVTGIKVVCNWPLLRRVSDKRKPPGDIMATDYTNTGEPPDFTSLGRRVKLLYFPPA